MRHWCMKKAHFPVYLWLFSPKAVEAGLHGCCTDIYIWYSQLFWGVSSLRDLKKQLLSSLLVINVYLNSPAPPPPRAHQITLKLLLFFEFDFLPDVAMTQLITLFWALWFWRDLITQYSLHRAPYIASAWWHSLWGCGCHDNLLRKIHNVSLPPSVVHMFTLSWWRGAFLFRMLKKTLELQPDEPWISPSLLFF